MVFNNCDRISRIECYCQEPPEIEDKTNMFTLNVLTYAIVHCPKNYKLDYASSYGWRDFKNIIDDLDAFVKAVDANIDNTIDVVDITAIASHILGKTPTTFSKAAADANKDGVIDVADITKTASIILTNQAKESTSTPSGILWVKQTKN